MRVYIAGPMEGDGSSCPYENVRKAMLMEDRIWEAGHVPEIPHKGAFTQMVVPRSRDKWMDRCLRRLATCDALLRLPGKSRGADEEVIFAEKNGIPVFHNFDELMLYTPPPKIEPVAPDTDTNDEIALQEEIMSLRDLVKLLRDEVRALRETVRDLDKTNVKLACRLETLERPKKAIP